MEIIILKTTSAWNSVSLAALIISIAGLGWQFYTYAQSKKSKIKITSIFGTETDDNFSPIDYIKFLITNNGEKKIHIISITTEYLIDFVKPKRQAGGKEVVHEDNNINFPLSLKSQGLFKYKVHFKYGEELTDQFSTQKGDDLASSLDSRSYIRKSCRLILIETSGKKFTSKWIRLRNPHFDWDES